MENNGEETFSSRILGNSIPVSCFFFFFPFFFFFLFVVNFVIHWNETAMGLHVFPIPIPPPPSLFLPCVENLKTFLNIIWKLKRTLSSHSFRHSIEIILIQPNLCVYVDRAEKIFSPTWILVAIIKFSEPDSNSERNSLAQELLL